MGAAALLQSPPTVHARSPVAEIEIRRSYVGGRPWAPPGVHVAPADMLLATDVLAQIEAAQARRALALLVTIQSAGGNVAAAFAIFHALRDFSRSGGIVVVYATGYLASTATMLMLAGDVVVIDPNAALEVHSMAGPKVDELNRSVLEVYAEHTRTPRTELERWLAMTGDDSGKIDPSLALRYGWADRIGERDEALGWAEQLAERLAQGFRYVTERHDVLLPRQAPLRGNLWPSDGYKPNQATPIARSPVLPGQVPPGTLADASSTRGAAVHNIFPNGTSDNNPPDGADLTTAEWAARVQDPGAASGSWVRQLSATINQRVIFGEDPDPALFPVSAFVGRTALGIVVPCSPGESFTFEAQARATAGVVGAPNASIDILFLDKNKTSGSLNGSSTTTPLTIGAAWQAIRCVPIAAPAGASYVYFAVHGDNISTTPATIQFDGLVAYRYTEAASSASSNAPSLAVAAGGNVFTDIPGTSQSFTPNTASRNIKVTLTFSAFATGTTAAAVQNVRIVFGGTPTQAGSIYNFAYAVINDHRSWSFMWVLPAATLGPVGTTVTVKAQVRSPTGNTAGLTIDGNDSVSMVIEEIG